MDCGEIAQISSPQKRVTIYALAHPDSPHLIRYIGKTEKPLHRRLCEHVAERNRTNGRNHRRNWVRALTAQGKKPAIWPLEFCTSDNWIEREQFWVRLFKPLGLVNGTDGGEGGTGNSGWKWSPEALTKISKLRKGKKISPEHAAKLRIQLREKALPKARTPEAIAKVRMALKGRRPSEQCIEATRKRLKGKPGRTWTEAQKEHMRRLMTGRKCSWKCGKEKRPVICVETGKQFESISLAAKKVGRSGSKIIRALKTGRTSAGFHWKYVQI